MPARFAYCGLDCSTCPIHLATIQEDGRKRFQMRSEIVRQCREHYGIAYTAADITDCDGCRSEAGRLFSASIGCPIRTCARNRNVENCAWCADYPCGPLEAFLAREPAARRRLEAMHRSRPA